MEDSELLKKGMILTSTLPPPIEIDILCCFKYIIKINNIKSVIDQSGDSLTRLKIHKNRHTLIVKGVPAHFAKADDIYAWKFYKPKQKKK